MEKETWFGSVLIVTKGGGLGGGPEPQLIWKTNRRSSASGAVPSQNAPAQNGGNANGLNGASGELYGVVNGVDYSSFQEPATSPQLPGNANAINGAVIGSANSGNSSEESKVPGTKLYSDPSNTFWRFDLQVPMGQSEIECTYSIPGLKFTNGVKTDKQSFFVPAISESMRIMFHSCNGFSVGTDEAAWSGAALWNDVLRVHQKAPFHVM
jgi:hypothetical protein